jgi:hypothetical protein
LKVGDQVLATDVETGQDQRREVTDARSVAGKKAFVTFTVDTDGKDGSKTGSITSTDNHLIWLPDAGMWVEAKQLKPGMWLQTASGTWVQITAVKRTVEHERVHNLTVDGLHTYYVLAGNTPVLVHNVNEPIPGVCGPGGEPIHQIPSGSSGGRGAGEEISRQDLIDYNIGVNRDPSKPTPLCSYCRQNPAEAVDHVEPRIHGGDRTDANLTPACRRCNSSKKDNYVPYNPPKGYRGTWPPTHWPDRMIQEWFMLHSGRK